MGKSGPKPRDPLLRFREKIRTDASGCWVWTAFIDPDGYGKATERAYKERNRELLAAKQRAYTLRKRLSAYQHYV